MFNMPKYEILHTGHGVCVQKNSYNLTVNGATAPCRSSLIQRLGATIDYCHNPAALFENALERAALHMGLESN